MAGEYEGLDLKKYGPLAVRDQLIAISACLVQVYGVLIELQQSIPPERAKAVQVPMKELSAKLTALLKAMDGTDE